MQQMLMSGSILAVVSSTNVFKVGGKDNMRLDLVIHPWGFQYKPVSCIVPLRVM